MALSGDQRLIVDYVIDGNTHAINGYFVSLPEPSTLVLVVMGVFGLLAYAWRKRK